MCSVRCDQVMCSERTVIKFSLCGTAREVFLGRISLRKKELSNDYGLKSRAVQTAINNAKQWQHQQPFVPTWAVRSRATCFPNGQQTRNLKHYPYDCSRNTLGKPEPHPHGEMIECSVGVATASRLRLAIPGARVRSLQDRSNNRAFGGPRKTNQFTNLRCGHRKMHDSASLGLPQLVRSAQRELFHSGYVASHLPTNRCSQTAPCSVPQVPPIQNRRLVFGQSVVAW